MFGHLQRAITSVSHKLVPLNGSLDSIVYNDQKIIMQQTALHTKQPTNINFCFL